MTHQHFNKQGLLRLLQSIKGRTKVSPLTLSYFLASHGDEVNLGFDLTNLLISIVNGTLTLEKVVDVLGDIENIANNKREVVIRAEKSKLSSPRISMKGCLTQKPPPAPQSILETMRPKRLSLDAQTFARDTGRLTDPSLKISRNGAFQPSPSD